MASTVLDLLYPPRCVACGRDDDWLCNRCVRLITVIEPPFCPTCGLPGGPCATCRDHPLRMDRIRAVGPHQGVLQQAIHALKYGNLTAVAPRLGGLMAATWRQYGRDVDMLIPVPLHPSRQKSRGYNQSLYLARDIGLRLGLPVAPHGLRRVRTTQDQIGLGRAERRRNVEGVFDVGPSLSGAGVSSPIGRHILLIDDVCTTGYTLDACAAPLLRGGVRSVSALVVARRTDG